MSLTTGHLSAIATLALTGDGLQGLLLPIGVILILMSLVMSIRKRKKRQAQQITPGETLERLRQEKGVRGDMESLMVEVEQMAKRVGAQLDAKAIRLERLIDEADRKLTELDNRTSHVGGRSYEADRPRDVSPTFYAGAMHQADGARSRSAPGAGGAAGPTASSAAKATSQDEPADFQGSDDFRGPDDDSFRGRDDLSRSVYSLADQGMDTTAIARQLGEHVGKVELILALRA